LHRAWFDIITDPLGEPISIPLLIGRGSEKGPVLGLTAAVHGNELNGIPVIQKLFKEIGEKTVHGTVIGVPVVNVPALLRKKRRFIDGVDLNHIMPGNSTGNVSQTYVHRFIREVVSKFDFLLDLHTASNGRINSYYVRADMQDEKTRQLALLQNAQIIVHNPPSDGTLRGAAEEMEITAITLEVGNPNTFQKGMISSGITGLYNALIHLKMIEGQIETPGSLPILCRKSYWIYTDRGGLLTVTPQVTDRIQKGQLIATQHNIFGDKIKEYFAPENGVVIGKSNSPVNQTGGRILHLGIEFE
jgi:predicted deacylase